MFENDKVYYNALENRENYCGDMRYALWLLLIGACEASFAQHTLSLFVADSLRGPVSNATVKINKKESILDSSGRFSITLSPGKIDLSISSVGYYTFKTSFELFADSSMMVILKSRESLLGNVVVTASRNVYRNQMSVQSLGIGQIKKLPVILGEIDPLKSITLLPGIKNGGEASAGIYVRGGGPDQNLVLLDGIPVYNPNHLLGFFSVFNGEAVNDIEVIKGGFPAEYGGRLSSVISVNTREGNKDSIKGSGGIGIISSRVSLEGPIIKGRSSFIVSARRTYIDQVARLVAKNMVGNNGYYFGDINAKADFIINKNNKLDFTFYTGIDDFTYVDNDDNDGRDRTFNAIWGNTIAGLSWKQRIGGKIRNELSAIYNNFDLDSKVTFGTNGFQFSSGLTDYMVKNDWTFTHNNWLKWKWGWQYTWHTFRPGAGGSNSGVQEFKNNIQDQQAHEAAAYVSTDVNLLPGLNLVAGLRYSYFSQVGPTEYMIYDADGVPTGELMKFSSGQQIASYHYPEPRASLLYKFKDESSIKLSYARTTQYLHLATTSAATFPGDLWVPASQLIQPGIAHQVAAGYFKNISNGAYEVSVEAYYKTLSNQLEFKPGARLLLNNNLEGEMIFGSGRAYGVELFAQKKVGKLTGWVGYTLSRTERTFPEMNEGKAFPYRYDRTHDLSVVANYTISPKWSFSGIFVYGTGNALTMPTGRFVYRVGYDGLEEEPVFTSINLYDKINDYRMPSYHRMDIAFTYTPKPNSTKRFKSSWNFSIYNVYSRYNPYFIYIKVEEDERIIQGKKVFLFPITPAVTWNFNF
jgi:hypothetical protein